MIHPLYACQLRAFIQDDRQPLIIRYAALKEYQHLEADMPESIAWLSARDLERHDSQVMLDALREFK